MNLIEQATQALREMDKDRLHDQVSMTDHTNVTIHNARTEEDGTYVTLMVPILTFIPNESEQCEYCEWMNGHGHEDACPNNTNRK